MQLHKHEDGYALYTLLLHGKSFACHNQIKKYVWNQHKTCLHTSQLKYVHLLSITSICKCFKMHSVLFILFISSAEDAYMETSPSKSENIYSDK